MGFEADTSDRASARYHELLRSMTPAQRWAAIASLCSGVRALALAGLRSRHPLASEDELKVRLTVRLYGRDVGRRLHGSVPDDAI